MRVSASRLHARTPFAIEDLQLTGSGRKKGGIEMLSFSLLPIHPAIVPYRFRDVEEALSLAVAQVSIFGTVKTRILGHPGVVVKVTERRLPETLLNGNCWAMRQDPKTVAVLFAPHTQQLTILDVSHMTCATPPKLPRTPRVHPGIVIAATLLAGLLSLGIR